MMLDEAYWKKPPIMMTPPKNEVINRLWRGSIDMHMHPAPDMKKDRRLDAVQAALQAQEAGMKAIVLKSTYYPTTPVAINVSPLAPNVKVIGSIALDYEVGGLNPTIVKCQAILGAKVLWMPAMSSIQSRRSLGFKDGIAIMDSYGKLQPVVTEILQIVKEHNIVLCSGHLDFNESVALFTEANRLGITKLVATHPLEGGQWPPFTIDQIKEVASMGAYIEHCFLNCMPVMNRYDPKKIVEAIKTVGAEQTILTTDMGQVTDPPQPEGMRMFIAVMLQLGLSESEVAFMVKTNPSKLLDLEE
jgi:hypothetical protein